MVLKIYDNWADVIFHKLYKVNVPVLSTYSIEELEIMGVPINESNDDSFDSTGEKVTVMITITEMIEKYNNGFRVAVVNHKDIEEIYRVINNHLLAWREFKSRSLNQNAIPVDDLIVLDKFADEIFKLNKITIVKSTEVNKVLFDNDFRSRLMGNSPKEKTKVDYNEIERESIAPEKEQTGKYDLNSLLM